METGTFVSSYRKESASDWDSHTICHRKPSRAQGYAFFTVSAGDAIVGGLSATLWAPLVSPASGREDAGLN